MTRAIRHARSPRPDRWRHRARSVLHVASTVGGLLALAALTVFAGIGVAATIAVLAVTS